MTIRRFLEILKYLLAGSFGVGLYFGLLYSLTENLHLWYLLSATIASITNCTSNFLLHKYWTFSNKGREDIRRQAVTYIALYMGVVLTNTGLLYLLVDVGQVHYLIAQIPVSILITIVSYLITRKIFKEK